MAIITEMSSSGRIALPKQLRNELNLTNGTRFVIIVDNDNILLKPIKTAMPSDYDATLDQAKQWASQVGMREEDISEAIGKVRGRK